MKQFKFRAWDKSNNMFYNKFAEKDEFIRNESQLAICENGKVVLVDDNDSYEADRNNFIIQQYTGLKDCKDVEIYEGDIISHPSKVLNKAVVKFTKGLFRIVAKDGRDDLLYYCYNIIEVIGNIFENKDLLEK